MAAKKFTLTRNVRIKNKLHKAGESVELPKAILDELLEYNAIDQDVKASEPDIDTDQGGKE